MSRYLEVHCDVSTSSVSFLSALLTVSVDDLQVLSGWKAVAVGPEHASASSSFGVCYCKLLWLFGIAICKDLGPNNCNAFLDRRTHRCVRRSRILLLLCSECGIYRCLTHITRDTPRFRLVSTGLDGVLSALYFTTKFCLLVLYTILHDPILETIPNAVARTHQAS